uniref:Histone-lysine N-methyltransferase n=1 Tax=Leersia perrieri TaxID=77586 RepID=A0A0D9XCY2_9ORYZ
MWNWGGIFRVFLGLGAGGGLIGFDMWICRVFLIVVVGLDSVMSGVEPPPPPALAPSPLLAGMARLLARGIKPRKVSAKRSWPPDCGRFHAPAPPPPAPVAGGDGINGVDVVVVPNQRGVEEVVAAVSPIRSEGPPPPLVIAGDDDGEKGRGGDGEKGVCSVAEGREEEVLVSSSAACNGTIPHAPSQPEAERMDVEYQGGGRETGESQLPDDRDALLSDGPVMGIVFDVMPLALAAPISCDDNVSNGCAENVGDVASLFVDRRGGNGGCEPAGKEVATDQIGRELESRVGVQLERTEEDVLDSCRKKRWLMSVLNPPPKRRAVSAIRRFPPECGRVASTLARSGAEELPLEVTPISVATGGISMEDLARTPIVPGLDHSSVSRDAKTIEDDECSKVENRTHEFQVATNVALDDFEGAITCPNDVITKTSPRHGFVGRVNGKGSPQEKKLVAQKAIGDGKMTRKCEGRLQEGTLETSKRDLVDVKAKHKILKTNMQDNARSSRDNRMKRKASSTLRGTSHSNMNLKQRDIARKVDATDKSKGVVNRLIEEPESGGHATPNRIIENDDGDFVDDRVIVQALMALDRCPWTQGRKSIGSVSQSRTPKHELRKKVGRPRKKLKDASPRKELSLEVASCKRIKHEASENKEDSSSEDGGNSKDSSLEDEDNSKEPVHEGKALVVREGRNQLCVTLPPGAPSGTDPRSKIRNILQKFQAACRKLMQVEERHIGSIGRIDIVAANALKQNGFTKPGPIVGNVAGVEVGDEFHFRIELAIVGLHRPYQAGIDSSKVNGMLVALSIVASGGYHDELSSSDELIYTGSGGKAVGNKAAEDQKLERGNLALKNCIETKTPVRVIHGFKNHGKGEASHSKSKQISTYIYDGLYMVVDCWQEGPKGLMVFKYRLQRCPNQPELALHIIKATRKSKVREGVCVPDISNGSERIPIPAINTIDDMKPAPIKYTAEVIYPHSYAKEPPKGCDCTNGCSDSNRCACAVKNAGEIPFNFSGAIVEAKPLIYECGPSCRCPPTCHNRVSQHGIKIPLEIFKTGKKGWGVRSLSSISSGSFVCEYTGEVLQDNGDEHIENDEYLFDVGHNYHDKVWEECKSGIWGLDTPEDKEGSTIDASKCSNVGRFINHSCSPNLYAQNVLWDHDDKKIPHIMFFASENIPPLQELTYHYNYSVGKLEDKNGAEKVKPCFCGSLDCSGRLY